MSAVFTIPEQVLRALPECMPGHANIKISNCQSPRIDSEDPTPSTFFFDQQSRRITLQMLYASPAQSNKPDRTFFGVLLERNPSGVPILQRRFHSAVVDFLQSLGAADTKQNLTDFLESINQQTDSSNPTPNP